MSVKGQGRIKARSVRVTPQKSLAHPRVCLFGVLRRINVCQLLNGDSSQIHVSWTTCIFNQYLT